MAPHDIAEVSCDPSILCGSIPDRFAAVVAHHRNRLAVATPSFQWSYAELNAVSDQLAIQMLALFRGLIQRGRWPCSSITMLR